MGILTVGIVTESGGNEAAGLAELSGNADMMLQLPFDTADDSMHNAVTCVLSLIRASFTMEPEDFKFLIREKGSASFGIGIASGTNRASDAVEQIRLNRRFVDRLNRADSIILNITGSKDVRYEEVKSIVETIRSVADPDANLIFGTVLDEEAQDSVVLAVVAAGTVRRTHQIVHTAWTTTGDRR